ncbi:MAG: L,D-transpeptidase [Candidatus Margulisiibacteriota bacterium]
MKKNILCLFVCFFFMTGGAFAVTFESLSIINGSNFASYFNNDLGFLYDSHGCLHFTPADIYLLTKTIPIGTPLKISKYSAKESDLGFTVATIRSFADITNSPADIEKHALVFKNGKTELVVYPSLGRLFILVNSVPYAQVKTLAGPSQDVLFAFDLVKGGKVNWDFALATPTDSGNFTILGSTNHYISPTYYASTIIPFGAWIVRNNGKYIYQEDKSWYELPSNIVEDIQLSPEKRQYNYFDVICDQQAKVQSARWGSHDFGKYALLWTKDGNSRYPELGYAAGELCYEQVLLIKDIVQILTLAGDDEFDRCIAQSINFSFYKDLDEFVSSAGEKNPANITKEMVGYYRLYNDLGLSEEDSLNMDERVVTAYDQYRNGLLPRSPEARQKALGLVYFLRTNSEGIKKQAHWYRDLKNNWEFWKNLRVKLRADFDAMGVLSIENRQNILEKWLNERLEFKTVNLPGSAKNIANLSFSEFFRPDEEDAVFSVREEAIMRKLISQASGEVKGLDLYSVKALNDYNFGVLLNAILGDLYKSHGCMHVSPRNMILLYKLLPLKTPLVVYDYSKNVTDKQINAIPDLAGMVNFQEDLIKLKSDLAGSLEVKIAVYPSSGLWIIYLGEKPFAKMQVKGGPKAKMYVVQERDASGKPDFEDHLAYPTSPGNFQVASKIEDYVSNIYYDSTMVPMGGVMRKDNGKWIFKDKKGKWRDIPKSISEDLALPENQRKNTYYDETKNSSGEVLEIKWGSQPFGRYAMQIATAGGGLSPELIHSSGDLMMEERQLVNDLIKVLSAPHDDFEKCAAYDQNFTLYRACYEFVSNPTKDGLLQPTETANYRLYYGLPLSAAELKLLPKDAPIVDKVLRGRMDLTQDEIKVLVDADIAYWRGGKLKINMEKALGVNFDTYQYVVTIQKFANHYEVLKNNWSQLSNLRMAILKDFNSFAIKDTTLFRNFMRELMLERIQLNKLTQQSALEVLKKECYGQN